ncbi:MAG: cation:proton antiporter [Caulobacteraceae bacterium]
MTAFQICAVFLLLIAGVGWVNARWLRLPNGVAMLLAGGAAPAFLPLLDGAIPQLHLMAGLSALVRGVDFSRIVLNSLLAFLLFAGAMQVDFGEMRRQRLSVFSLATLGVFASTAIVGLGAWAGARLLGLDLPLPWAIVFGALISPTDPIAVVATVKRGELSPRLKAVLQGEALFNDGVGIVVFTAAVAFLSGTMAHGGAIIGSIVVEAAGGLALGLAAGALAIRAMRAIDDYAVEVAISLALATGVYALAQLIHLSGPVAVVGAGLLFGDTKAAAAMSETSRVYLRGFWTLVDEILNALLFLLLGLELLVVRFTPLDVLLSLVVIPLVLLARFVVVAPWGAYFGKVKSERGATRLLVWGGLHGALSLALALTLPEGPARALVLSTTYATVVFSVVAQGLTFTVLVRRLAGAGEQAAAL